MATMRPTPRNELLGLLSDAYKWMQSPERAQQMQGFAGLLGTTGVPQTIERMAYGEPLTNIGRANVPLLKPETADALMTVAPFAPKGMKMIRATEGLPVGMGIKSVGDDIFNLSKQEFLGKPRITKNANAADLKPIELTTLKDIEPQPFMGGKYQIKMNEDGAVVLDKGKPIASYNFGDTLVVDKPYRKSGLAQELVYEWRTSFPAPAVAKERTKASQSIQEKVWERIQNEKRSLPKQSPYPQQAPLSIAEQRSGLLDMTRTPSEAEIKKMSREDLIQWLQNNDPDGQYMDPTPNPSVSMYRTGKGYAVENADSGDVFEFKDFNEAQKEFNSMRFSNAEFPPMTLQEAQESAINYLREFAQPEEGAKVIPFQSKGLLSP